MNERAMPPSDDSRDDAPNDARENREPKPSQPTPIEASVRGVESVWTDRPIEVLIARVVDGEATQAEWDRLCLEAQRQPALWRELAESQREQSALVAAVGRVLAAADEVEAPAHELGTIQFHRRARSFASWGGWAVAALVALTALGPRFGLLSSSGPTAGVPGTLQPVNDSDLLLRDPAPKDVLAAYYNRGMQRGTVLGEMPERVLVGTRPAVNGQGVEVVYIRQIMEREVVPGLYRLGTDEAGRPTPIRAEIQYTNGKAY